MPLYLSPYASCVRSTSSSSEISILHSTAISSAATPRNLPDPSSIPAGISGREWLATGTRACRVRMVYSLPSHSRIMRTPTAPPRMKTLPGTVTIPLSPPQFTLAVDWNLMKPTFGPNMSRDCTRTSSTNSRGSASTSAIHSINTGACITASRSMPGSAVIGTLVRPPSTLVISTVAASPLTSSTPVDRATCKSLSVRLPSPESSSRAMICSTSGTLPRSTAVATGAGFLAPLPRAGEACPVHRANSRPLSGVPGDRISGNGDELVSSVASICS